jgi:ABC-2 type transport system ATP-binding protein
VHAPVSDRVAALTEVARTLQDENIPVVDLGLRRPTLDDVFLRLTGRPADAPPQRQREVVL